MHTYTGKLIEYDVEIQTSKGEATAKRWVLDRGEYMSIVENIFNKYKGKTIRITVEEM